MSAHHRSVCLSILSAVILCCGGEVNTQTGMDGGGDAATDSASSGDAFAGYTRCSAPNGDMLCGGACGDGCPGKCQPPREPDGGFTATGGLAACGNASAGFLCYKCSDGDLCIDFFDVSPPPAPDAFASTYEETHESIGVMFALNGFGDHVRYADRSAYTETPIPPPPTSCPNVSGLQLCGGACGSCPDKSVCMGRSPLHPYSICVPELQQGTQFDVEQCKRGQPTCFVFEVDSASQPVADQNGVVVTPAQCAVAAQYPGGAFCQ
jgi:hypothetical protein